MYIPKSALIGGILAVMISITMLVTVQYASLFGPYGPYVSLNEQSTVAEVQVFAVAKINQIMIEYPTNHGVVAPLGCSYDLVTDEVVSILCGASFGLNKIKLAGDAPFWVTARIATPRQFAFPPE